MNERQLNDKVFVSPSLSSQLLLASDLGLHSLLSMLSKCLTFLKETLSATGYFTS